MLSTVLSAPVCRPTAARRSPPTAGRLLLASTLPCFSAWLHQTSMWPGSYPEFSSGTARTMWPGLAPTRRRPPVQQPKLPPAECCGGSARRPQLGKTAAVMAARSACCIVKNPLDAGSAIFSAACCAMAAAAVRPGPSAGTVAKVGQPGRQGSVGRDKPAVCGHLVAGR